VVVRDVFAGQPELFERFKKFIGFTSDDELGTHVLYWRVTELVTDFILASSPRTARR
jgi:hypothetical protein